MAAESLPEVGNLFIGMYPADSITIGDNIELVYVKRSGNEIKFQCRAPKSMNICHMRDGKPRNKK